MYAKVKRTIDVACSFLMIIVTLPLFLFVALAIKLDTRGPVFFIQERIGYKCKNFKIIKFRSMLSDSEKGGVYTDRADTRVTRVGKFIRATSIDELPQLFNIIRGDMSLIGPRPPLPYHPKKIENYTSVEKKRFDVKPGITGWAQVKGRKQLLWSERFKYDVEYVNNISFCFDFKIFLMTIVRVIAGSDNQNTGSTAK